MSLVEHLMDTQSKLDLAKIAKAQAHEIAALKDAMHRLKVELFWVKARERDELAAVETSAHVPIDLKE